METDVIAERLKNLTDMVIEFKDENKIAHNYTNGKVRRLEVWKGTIAGALAVVVFVSGYALKDYFQFKTSIFEAQKQNLLINEQIKNLDKRLQAIEGIIVKE